MKSAGWLPGLSKFADVFEDVLGLVSAALRANEVLKGAQTSCRRLQHTTHVSPPPPLFFFFFLRRAIKQAIRQAEQNGQTRSRRCSTALTRGWNRSRVISQAELAELREALQKDADWQLGATWEFKAGWGLGVPGGGGDGGGRGMGWAEEDRSPSRKSIAMRELRLIPVRGLIARLNLCPARQVSIS